MLDLSEKEREAALWCIHTVAAAYGKEPPDGSVIDGLRRKLLEEPAPAPAKAGHITGP